MPRLIGRGASGAAAATGAASCGKCEPCGWKPAQNYSKIISSYSYNSEWFRRNDDDSTLPFSSAMYVTRICCPSGAV